MVLRFLTAAIILLAINGCHFNSDEDYILDSGIPRVETPSEQIATVRTKWLNEKHIETAFLDKDDRILEEFRFGRSNGKELNQYEGKNQVLTISCFHSDSSPFGSASVDSLWRGFDSDGKLTSEKFINTEREGDKPTSKINYYWKKEYSYTAQGDTIVKTYHKENKWKDDYIDIKKWTTDRHLHPTHYYRLFVIKRPNRPNDTTEHFSKRFAYDFKGRLALTWYDYMYLGKFYVAQGPDIIRYSYGKRNRLVRELRFYTIDMNNKSEADTTGLSEFQKESHEWRREKFCVGDDIFHNNAKTDTVSYRYETFEPKKHLPMKIPALD